MLEFWFDFASTYSYVAASRIERLCKDAGVELIWKPFTLGPIFAMQGWNDSHFNLNQRRGDYMWRDMERLTAKLGLPWKRPSQFPRNSVPALRIACAIAGESWCGEYIRRIFARQLWRRPRYRPRVRHSRRAARTRPKRRRDLRARRVPGASRRPSRQYRASDRTRHLRRSKLRRRRRALLGRRSDGGRHRLGEAVTVYPVRRYKYALTTPTGRTSCRLRSLTKAAVQTWVSVAGSPRTKPRGVQL